MDRRADPRVEVRLPCHVEIHGSKVNHYSGTTTNISRTGILILWRAADAAGLPRVGQVLSVDVELPANHAFGRRCLHCQAVVSRVSRNETGGPEVAVQVSQMQFRKYDPSSAEAQAGEKETRCAVM